MFFLLSMFQVRRQPAEIPHVFGGLIPNSAEAVGVTAILPTEQRFRQGPLDWFKGKSTGNSGCLLFF